MLQGRSLWLYMLHLGFGLAVLILFVVTASWTLRAALALVFFAMLGFEVWRWFWDRRGAMIVREIEESRQWEREQIQRSRSRG